MNKPNYTEKQAERRLRKYYSAPESVLHDTLTSAMAYVVALRDGHEPPESTGQVILKLDRQLELLN